MLMDARLERDIATPASQAFPVLAIELDSGPVFLAGCRTTLGGDVLHSALLSLGEVSAAGFFVTIEQQALPAYADGWWINRAAALIECTPDMESVYDGTLRFDGRIEAEPAEQGGVLSFSVAPYRKIVKTLPGLGLITADAWPLAADSAMGAQKPMIFGIVESCPLLPVQVRPSTTLTASALPDTSQLEVADTAAMASSGSVVVDGITYSYTHKDASLLLGMSITRAHASGTLVAQAGSNVYLAAGEAVSGISEIRAGAVRIDGGVVDLAAATVTFASPPAVVASATRYTLDEHFDAIAAGNTCSNAANAIRAALNSYTQSGTASGPVTAAAAGSITFARPADGNRIISGAYAVQFSVAVGAQVGWARVRIGSDIVWSYDPGVGVLYNWSPCAITMDDDADVLPVSVEVESGGSTDQVTVTVIAASRVVVTGNLDEANYATIAPGQALKVTQTDTPPDRGRIARARLVVRWFATDAAMGTTAVKFGGATLGKLALTPNSGASINKTVSINSVTQGAASLPQTSIVTAATKTDSQIAFPVSMAVSTSVARSDPGLANYSLLHPIDFYLPLPPNVAAGTYPFYFYFSPHALPAGNYASYWVEVNGSAYQVNQDSPPNPLQINVSLAAGQSTVRIRQGGGPSFGVWPSDFLQSGYHHVMRMVYANVNASPTVSAVSVSASSQPIAAASLANAGINVSLANNQIQMTVPAPPRVVDTVFDLPSYTEWSQFGAKTAEITLTGTGASVCVVETYLQIEFDEIAYAAADGITATVTGRSGNPADVLATLAAASGEAVDLAGQVRLSAWCSGNGMSFARRVADTTDALQMLTYAAEQCGCDLHQGGDGLLMRRWSDDACDITSVSDADLLDMPSVEWAQRVDTDITLSYREDYAGSAGMTRVLRAYAGNTPACARTESATLVTSAISLDGGWLRSDAAAALLLSAYVGRYAAMRRTTRIDLPYTFGTVEAGSLIDWRDALWRVLSVANDNGWIALQIEERPA